MLLFLLSAQTKKTIITRSLVDRGTGIWDFQHCIVVTRHNRKRCGKKSTFSFPWSPQPSKIYILSSPAPLAIKTISSRAPLSHQNSTFSYPQPPQPSKLDIFSYPTLPAIKNLHFLTPSPPSIKTTMRSNGGKFDK